MEPTGPPPTSARRMLSVVGAAAAVIVVVVAAIVVLRDGPPPDTVGLDELGPLPVTLASLDHVENPCVGASPAPWAFADHLILATGSGTAADELTAWLDESGFDGTAAGRGPARWSRDGLLVEVRRVDEFDPATFESPIPDDASTAVLRIWPDEPCE